MRLSWAQHLGKPLGVFLIAKGGHYVFQMLATDSLKSGHVSAI